MPLCYAAMLRGAQIRRRYALMLPRERRFELRRDVYIRYAAAMLYYYEPYVVITRAKRALLRLRRIFIAAVALRY